LQAILSLANGNLSNSGLGLMLLFFKRKFYQNQPEKSSVFGVQMWSKSTANPGALDTEKPVIVAVRSGTKICLELAGIRTVTTVYKIS